MCTFYLLWPSCLYKYFSSWLGCPCISFLLFFCWSNVCPALFCMKDVSDAQWRNLRGNIPVLTLVFGIFTLLANLMRAFFNLKVGGMSIVWLLFSLTYLSYLHGAWYSLFWCFAFNVLSFTIGILYLFHSNFVSVSLCSIVFILSIATVNFLLVKVCVLEQWISISIFSSWNV